MKKLILFTIIFAGIYGFSATEASAQCVNYLGRANEKLCEKPADMNQCLEQLKQGSMIACVGGGKMYRRIGANEVEADMAKRGCKKIGAGAYECASDIGYNTCVSYENYFRLFIGFPSPGQPVPPPAPVGRCTKAAKPTQPLGNNPIPDNLEGGNLYVFAVGQDNKLWAIKKSYGQWGSPKRVGSVAINGGPDACSSNPGKMLVMYRDSGNKLEGMVFDGSLNAVGGAQYISMVGSDPSIACQAGDRISFFVRGHNNNGLYANYAENGVWNQLYTVENGNGLAIEDVAGKSGKKSSKGIWEYLPGGPGAKFSAGDVMLGASGLGGEMKGSPDSAAYGGNSQVVFVRSSNDEVWWRISRDGKPWEQFANLGLMKVSSDPAAVSRKSGEITVFARGNDNKLYLRVNTNSIWSASWFPWGDTVMASGPDAASWGGNRLDVVFRGADGSLYHVWLDDLHPYGKTPKVEKIPGMIVKGDPTIVATTW